jgi:hypothetical protein
MCTDCHSGQNPFIVHPGTAVDLLNVGVAQNTGNWYNPIVPAGWLENPGPGTMLNGVALGSGDGSCLQCHIAGQGPNGAGPFASLTKSFNGFCTILLREARVRNQMPPFPTTQSYQKHWDALANACSQTGQPIMQMPASPRYALNAALIMSTLIYMR